MDCVCSGYYRLTISPDHIFNGLVGIYLSSWYATIYYADSGTFSLCSSQLGKQLSLMFFNVVATIVTICVILLWALVAVRTFIEGWKGEIFYAPCLASIGDRIPESVDMTVEPQTTNTTNERQVG